MSNTPFYNRSPLFYVGDKYKLIPQIKDHFPHNINRFIEPFCGGGSVFLNTEANKYFLNDIDAYIMRLHHFLISSSHNTEKFWKLINNTIKKYNLSATYCGKDVPPDYRLTYIKTYFARYNKEAYCKMRDDFNNNKDNMLLLYMLLIYGFNRMLRFNSSGKFNLPVGNVDFNKNVFNALNAYFSYVTNKNINLYNLDFECFLRKLKPTSTDFVYLDPPYLITSSQYNELWDEKDEIRLINTLDGLDSKNVKFAISNIIKHKGKFNSIFAEWSKKYDVVTIKSNYINYHDNTEKGSLEVLVKNY